MSVSHQSPVSLFPVTLLTFHINPGNNFSDGITSLLDSGLSHIGHKLHFFFDRLTRSLREICIYSVSDFLWSTEKCGGQIVAVDLAKDALYNGLSKPSDVVKAIDASQQ